MKLVLKKLQLTEKQIQNFITSCYSRYKIINLSNNIFYIASNLRIKYSLSYFDSIIVATALEEGCNILYSEDMQQNQIIENTLHIINPF